MWVGLSIAKPNGKDAGVAVLGFTFVQPNLRLP
jgi:hypothetical protein